MLSAEAYTGLAVLCARVLDLTSDFRYISTVETMLHGDSLQCCYQRRSNITSLNRPAFFRTKLICFRVDYCTFSLIDICKKDSLLTLPISRNDEKLTVSMILFFVL